MEVEKYFKEKERMCMTYYKEDFEGNNICSSICPLFESCDNYNQKSIINQVNEIKKVIQWSQDNPKYTYLDNFVECFPKWESNSDLVPKTFCRDMIYQGKSISLCNNKKDIDFCKKCWNGQCENKKKED